MSSLTKSLIGRVRKWAGREVRQSFALNRLDELMADIIGKRSGFFIEAGANDGVLQSNSLYFEKYLGWSGILIEPIPEYAEACRKNRPGCVVEQCALVAADGPELLDLHVAGLMSVAEGGLDSNGVDTIQGHLFRARGFGELKTDCAEVVSCATKTLSEVIDAHGSPRVDLLALDVEGYEYQALSGLDLNRHVPQYILVEQRDGSLVPEILAEKYEEYGILNTSKHYRDVLYQVRE